MYLSSGLTMWNLPYLLVVEFEQHQERPYTTNPRDRMLKGLEPGDPDQGPSRDIMPIQPPIQPPMFGPVPRVSHF